MAPRNALHISLLVCSIVAGFSVFLFHLNVYPVKVRLHTAIGPISYPGQWDLMVHLRKHSVIFSRMHFVTFVPI